MSLGFLGKAWTTLGIAARLELWKHEITQVTTYLLLVSLCRGLLDALGIAHMG